MNRRCIYKCKLASRVTVLDILQVYFDNWCIFTKNTNIEVANKTHNTDPYVQFQILTG